MRAARCLWAAFGGPSAARRPTGRDGAPSGRTTRRGTRATGLGPTGAGQGASRRGPGAAGARIASARGSAETDLGREIPGLVPHLGGVATWATGRIGTFGAFLFEFILGAIIAPLVLHHRFAVRAFLNRLLARSGGAFAGGLFSTAPDTTRNAFAAAIHAAVAQTVPATLALHVARLPSIILRDGFTFLLASIQIWPAVVLCSVRTQSCCGRGPISRPPF